LSGSWGFSKGRHLEQFLCRKPMLAQANASKQGVLQLLQG
jgi:hypothetical protein